MHLNSSWMMDGIRFVLINKLKVTSSICPAWISPIQSAMHIVWTAVGWRYSSIVSADRCEYNERQSTFDTRRPPSAFFRRSIPNAILRYCQLLLLMLVAAVGVKKMMAELQFSSAAATICSLAVNVNKQLSHDATAMRLRVAAARGTRD